MLLVTGGIDGVSGSGLTDSTEIYDPDIGSWRTRAALPSPMQDMRAASLGNRVLVFGIDILLQR